MDTNPYESPRVAMTDEVSPALMKKARLILERRDDTSGIWFYVKRTWKQQIVFVVVFLFGPWYIWSLGLRYLAMATAGLLIGTKLRDIRWWWSLTREWPDTQQVLDWEKITALANGHNVSEPRDHSGELSE